VKTGCLLPSVTARVIPQKDSDALILHESYTFYIVVLSFYYFSESRWLRRYATSRKVSGSGPDEVIDFFSLPNPSSPTMALGFTQPLTEMSVRRSF
jgi:hypothetical protein